MYLYVSQYLKCYLYCKLQSKKPEKVCARTFSVPGSNIYIPPALPAGVIVGSVCPCFWPQSLSLVFCPLSLSFGPSQQSLPRNKKES